MMFAWAQDESEGQAFNQSTSLAVICKDNPLFDDVNQNTIFYTPDLQKVDLSKLDGIKANKFYSEKDGTADARGTLNGFIKDGKQYVAAWVKGTEDITAFVHEKGDKILISSLKYEGNVTPVKVHIDCTIDKLWIGEDGKKQDFECIECSQDASQQCVELLQEYSNSPLLANEAFKAIILEDPCILERGTLIKMPDYIVFEESDLSKIAAMGIGCALIAPVMEVAAPIIAAMSTEEAVRRGGQLVVGSSVDYAIQVLINYYFILEEPNDTWGNAFTDVDVWQVGASGVEAAFDKAWLAMATSCLLDALTEDGKLTGEFNETECLKGVLSAALAEGAFKGLGNAYKKLADLAKTRPSKFRKGLENFDLSTKETNDVLAQFGLTALKSIDELSNTLKQSNYLSKLGDLTTDQVDNLVAGLENKFDDNGAEILSGLIDLVDNGTTFSNLGRTINDFTKLRKEGYEHFGDGSKWVLSYLTSSNGKSVLKGKKVICELSEKTSEDNIRYIDVAIETSVGKRLLYEFKSVKNVPPGKFNEQFMKDLDLASSLDDIKWLFDGQKLVNNGKTDSYFEEKMKAALEKLPLNDDLAKKLIGIEDSEALRVELISNFNSIFNLK